MAWHERQVTSHLDHLRTIGAESGEPGRGSKPVLTAYALMTHEVARRHHGTDLAALVHHGEHLHQAEDQLTTLLQDLLAEAAEAGAVRSDVAPAELAAYGLNALGAARGMPSAGRSACWWRSSCPGCARPSPDAHPSRGVAGVPP